MTMKLTLLEYLFVLFVFVTLNAFAQETQSPKDRIIVGTHLAKLWDAMQSSKVKLNQNQLKRHIAQFELSAILLPAIQPSEGKVRKTRLCFKAKTVFDEPDLEISKSDFDQLMRYATDRVFELAASYEKYASSNNEEGRRLVSSQFEKYLTELNETERAPSRVFAGALFADYEPRQGPLAEAVLAYRAGVESDTKLVIESGKKNQWLTGQPYVAGNQGIDAEEIWKVSPMNVVTVPLSNGWEAKGVWVKSKYIVVPIPAADQALGVGSPESNLGLSKSWNPKAFQIAPLNAER